MPEDLTSLVTPNANAQPPITVESNKPDAGGEDGALPTVPEKLLKIPAVAGLLTGKPGAFSLPIKESKNHEDLQDLAKYKDWLSQAGMNVYTAMDGKTGVVFNQLYIHPEELKAADAAGQLTKVAPPFDQLNHLIGKSGTMHPALNMTAPVPVGLKGAPVPQPPQMGSPVPPVQPPSAALQKKISTARLSNAEPGSPTSGPTPGQGAILRNILKPVI